MRLFLTARGKINLFLSVGRRRPDHYHNVCTVLQSISLADRLTVSSSDCMELAVEGDAPGGGDNLVLRAASVLAPGKTAALSLHKGIPQAAGLGGGSADAAAALIGLNQLWGLGLVQSELLEVAARLGADVPFTLIGGSAVGRERGEALSPAPPLPDCCVVLLKPPFSVETKEAYHLLGPRRGSPEEPSELLEALAAGDLGAIGAGLHNDFEEATLVRFPELVARRREALAAGALGCALSGSGPTLFALVRDPAAAEHISAAWEGKGDILMARPEPHGVTVDLVDRGEHDGA